MRRAVSFALPLSLLAGLGVLSLIVVQQTGVLSSTSRPALDKVCAVLAEQRELAYQAIREGQVEEGTAILVDSLRFIPGDDPGYIDDALVEGSVDSLRLAVFSIAELMDDKRRAAFMDTCMDVKVYPTDQLVNLTFTIVNDLTYSEALPVVDDLWALAESLNPIARLGALGNLASPYIFNKWPHRAEARRRLVAEYGDLEAGPAVVRWSLQAAKRYRGQVAQTMALALEEELTTPVERQLLESDPAATRLAEALPALTNLQSRQSGLDWLCAGITEEEDWKVRLACLDLAVAYDDLDDTVQTACSTLALSGLDTPDVTRAKSLMLGYAIKADDLEWVRYWGEELLAIDRIRDQFDRPMHEGIRSNIEQYADFLHKAGFAEDAAQVYERLAAKYPNSALADRSYQRADQIRKEAGR